MISVLLKGDGAKLHMPIPPGVAGYSPAYKTSTPYSVKAANMLLDRYNYKIGADGWRRTPEGKPLVIELITANTSRGQQQGEFWKKTLDNIHIKLTSKAMPFAEGIKLEKQCKTMFKSSAWIADYPDADNFMQLFYGKTSMSPIMPVSSMRNMTVYMNRVKACHRVLNGIWFIAK